MITGIGRITLLVRDHQVALEFYRDLLGFEVRYDETVERHRYLLLGVPGQDLALWVLAVGRDDRHVVGRQGGLQPYLVLYADRLDELETLLRSMGVQTWGLQEGPDTRSLHVRDPDGNVLLVSELHAPAGD